METINIKKADLETVPNNNNRKNGNEIMSKYPIFFLKNLIKTKTIQITACIPKIFEFILNTAALPESYSTPKPIKKDIETIKVLKKKTSNNL